MLCWRADEAAGRLETSVASVNSALQRARARIGEVGREPGEPLRPFDPVQCDLLARYCAAFERHDVETLVALLHSDATMSMPPFRSRPPPPPDPLS